MKSKFLYSLSILFLGALLFFYVKNQQEQSIDLESSSKNPSGSKQPSFILKQDIYLFEEEKNTFIKVD